MPEEEEEVLQWELKYLSDMRLVYIFVNGSVDEGTAKQVENAFAEIQGGGCSVM